MWTVKYSVVSAVLLSLLVSPLFSQTNTENFARLDFNFNNPGARASALGGAFVSIADDATASEANPAGLTALLKPEFSLEVKTIQYTRDIFNFDSQGTAGNFDLQSRDFDDSVFSLSYASIVYPFSNFTLAAFRHELVNFESEYFTRGALVPTFTDGTTYFPVRSSTQLKVDNWGGGIGLKLSDRISIGASGGISVMDAESLLRRFSDQGLLNVANTSRIDDDDSDFFVNVGLLIRAHDRVTFGATFKRRPSFEAKHVLTDFIVAETPVTDTRTINFNIPMSVAGGVSVRPTDVLTLALDVVYIKYSELTDDFVITAVPGSFSSDDYEADDGIEIHVGAEYVGFINQIGYVLRGGYFFEPTTSIEFVGNDNGDFTRRVFETLFQEGDSDQHFTLGLGLLLRENLQLDLAGDISDGSKAFIASIVIRP